MQVSLYATDPAAGYKVALEQPTTHASRSCCAVLWSLARHLGVAMRGTGRAAAMALLTRGVSLLPRSAGGAGGSAFTDLLLFERSMQRSYAQHAEGEGADVGAPLRADVGGRAGAGCREGVMLGAGCRQACAGVAGWSPCRRAVGAGGR